MKTNQVLSTSLTSASFSSSPEACFFYFVSLGRFTEVSFLVFPWVFPYSHIDMEVQPPTKLPQFFPYSHIFRWVFPWVFPPKIPRVSINSQRIFQALWPASWTSMQPCCPPSTSCPGSTGAARRWCRGELFSLTGNHGLDIGESSPNGLKIQISELL